MKFWSEEVFIIQTKIRQKVSFREDLIDFEMKRNIFSSYHWLLDTLKLI